MTAAVTITNGKAEIAYTGEVPWHGLGQELKPGAPIEEWLTAAGMAWKIRKAFVRYPVSKEGANDSATYRVFDGNVVLFRGDTGAGLGIVSDKFNVVQPAATLEFFRDLVGSAGCELSTAGTLFDGRKFWAMATIGREAIVADKRDRVKANLLLSTACDGSMATEARFCATRVVCNNTLQIAKGETGGGFVKVNHRSVFDPQKVKAELGIESAISEFDTVMERMRAMAATPMPAELVMLATCGLLKPGYAELDEKAKHRVLNSKPLAMIARHAIDNNALGAEYDGVKGTVYGWLNSVTQYVDHEARAMTDSHRMDSAFFGANNRVKERAFEMAGAVVDNYRPDAGNALASVNDWIASTGAAPVDGAGGDDDPM